MAQLQPTWDLKRKKTAQADEIEKQKEQMEKQLAERAKRLSRLSTRLTQSGKNNLTQKLKAFEVEQINQQIEELQNNMRQEERERKETELKERRRQQEEADLRKRTETMERAYKDVDPNAVDPAVSLRAQRRKTAMMSIRATGQWSEEEFKSMEAQQTLEEQKEVKERELQRAMTEKKLKEIEDQIKRKERAKEEERLKTQARNLALLEKKLKNLEDNIEKDDDTIMSEDQLQREIARRQQEWKARQEADRKQREKAMLEAERLQREKDEALMKRKMEMERRLRDVEMALQEKQREREEERLRKQADKLAKMEEELAALNSGADDEEYQMQVKNYDYMMMEKKVKELQEQVNSRKNGSELEVEEKLRQLREKEAMLNAMEEKNKQMDLLMSKMGILDAIWAKLNALSAGGFSGGGGGGGGGGGVNSVEQMKKEIQELQQILFSPTASEKEISDANIRLEKVMAEYEKTGEYQAEVARAKAEKRAKHEPANKAALAKLKQIYNPQNVKANPELLQKIGESPELRFLFMEPETILKLHPADFKAFSMRNLTLEELRAIRATLPQFRRDQKVQSDWMESLDDKIENMSNSGDSGAPKPKSNKPHKVFKPKAAPAGGGTGDVFAELLAKKNGGLKHSPGPAAHSSASHNAAPPKPYGKLPPIPKAGGGPPLPPPSAPAPAPPTSSGAPPTVSLDQFKKVKACLEKLLKGLASSTPNEKDIAQDTRVAVTEIKQLARLQKPKEPAASNAVEDSASELVVAVKAVLVSRKAGGADFTNAKAKLAVVIDSVRNHCIKCLGPNARDYIK